MDIFLEYLMEKRPTGADLLKKLGIVVLALIASFLVMNIFLMFGQFMAAYIPLGIAAVVYGAYVWLRNFNLEYEYIFTNGELDIDVIKSRKVRKRLTSVSCKNIEVMAPADSSVYKRDFESQAISKKYNAVYDAQKGGLYCVIYNVDGVRTLLTFQPPENLVEGMRKFNPRNIFAE